MHWHASWPGLGRRHRARSHEHHVLALTAARTPCSHVGSWMGSAQYGPPMRKPEPVSGQRSGTAGPAPGMNLMLLPFTTCRGRQREVSCSVPTHCCDPKQDLCDLADVAKYASRDQLLPMQHWLIRTVHHTASSATISASRPGQWLATIKTRLCSIRTQHCHAKGHMMCHHLASESLEVEGLAALALIHVRQLRACVFHLRSGRVYPDEHPDIEVDAERDHLQARTQQVDTGC